VKAGSALLAAASAAALIGPAGCGGSGSGERTDPLEGVKAHRLADAPSRNADPATARADRASARADPAREPAAWSGPYRLHSRALTVAGDGIYGRWYTPASTQRPMPAVVVFGGSNGGLRVAPFARAFASYGYPALALAYFRAPGLPDELRDIPLEYFKRAIRFVKRQRGVDRVAVVGTSRGGEAALLLGSTYPKLIDGVIGIVPAYQVNGGWTLRGKEIPYDTPIRVERIRGPILTASGGRDMVWSSSVYTDQIELRLEDAHFRFPHERLDYPDEGHGLTGVQADLWRHIRAFMQRLV
jgi:dienelactone hydrolase